jgi:phage FluMu protein Com
MMQESTVILNSNNLPGLEELRCMACGKLLMRINRRILVFLNSSGAAVKEIPTGVGYQQAKCHGCNTLYNIHWS